MDACNCCSTPYCTGPFLRWDSSGASKTAPTCYFDGFIINPDKRYKKKETKVEVEMSKSFTLVTTRTGSPTYHNAYSSNSTSVRTDTIDFSPGCSAPISSCDGPGKVSFYCDWSNLPASDPEGVPYATGNSSYVGNSCTGAKVWSVNYPGGTDTYPNGVCIETFGPAGCSTDGPESLDQADTETTRIKGSKQLTTCYNSAISDEPGFSSINSGSSFTSTKTTTTLSEAYTFAQLKGEMLSAIDPLDGVYGDTGSAYYGRAGWSVSGRMAKAQIVHQPSQTGYFRVWYRKVITPAGGSATYGGLESYVWTGGPPDPNKPWDHPDNRIFYDLPLLSVPSEEQTETYELVKWSCVEGWVPATGESGFPTNNE